LQILLVYLGRRESPALIIKRFLTQSPATFEADQIDDMRVKRAQHGLTAKTQNPLLVASPPPKQKGLTAK
jgi:hypothetical protein